jgi:hypothetical protein
MKEAALFLTIFGIALVAAGISLCVKKDPRKSVLLYKMNKSTPLEKAKKTAVEVGSAVIGVGAAIIIYFAIMYFSK